MILCFQLAGLAARCGFQYLLITSNEDPLRPLNPRAIAMPRASNACNHLFKNTFEEVAAKIESFVTTGLQGMDLPINCCLAVLIHDAAGTLNNVKGKKINVLKKQARELILTQLRECCKINPAHLSDNIQTKFSCEKREFLRRNYHQGCNTVATILL